MAENEILGFNTGDFDELRKVFKETVDFYDSVISRMESIEKMGGISGLLGTTSDFNAIRRQITMTGDALDAGIVEPITNMDATVRSTMKRSARSVNEDFIKPSRRNMRNYTDDISSSMAGMYSNMRTGMASMSDLTEYIGEVDINEILDASQIEKARKKIEDEMRAMTASINDILSKVSLDQALSDPQMSESLEEMQARVLELKDAETSLVSEEKEFARKREESREKALRAEMKLEEQIKKQSQTLAELGEIYEKTPDPAARLAIIEKWEAETTKLEKYKKELSEIQELSSKMTLSSEPNAAFSEVQKLGESVKANATAALLVFDNVSFIIRAAIKEWGDLGDDANEKSKEATEKIKELIVFIGDAAEQVSLGAQKGAEIQQGLMQAAETISQLQSELIKKSYELSDAGNTGAADFFGMLAQGTGKMANLVKIIGKGVLVFTAVMEGIKLGFAVMDFISGTTAEKIKERTEALKEEIAVTKKLNNIIMEGSVEAIERERREIEQSIRDKERERREILANAEANTNWFDKTRTAMGSLFFGSSKLYGQVGEDVEAADEELEALNEELERFNDEGLRQATLRMQEFNKVVEQADEVMEEYTDKEADLLKIRTEIFESEVKLRQEMTDLNTEFANETTTLLNERNAEDKKIYAEHLDNLSTIDTDYQDALEKERLQLFDDLIKMEKDYRIQVDDAREELGESLKSMTDDYQKSEKERLKEFQEAETEARQEYLDNLIEQEEQYNKERLQRQKDLAEELFQAEMDNDALQFFNLKRQAAKDEEEAKKDRKEQLDEDKKDFEERKAERKKEFDEETKLEREQFDLSMKERYEEYQKELVDLQKKYDDERAIRQVAYEEALDEERLRYDRELVAAKEAYEKAAALRKLERTQEDYDRQAQREARRAELLSNYQAELEYFQQREALLLSYLEALDAPVQNRQAIVDAIEDGMLSATERAAMEMTASLAQGQIDAMQAIIDAGGALSIPETELMTELQNLVSAINSNPSGGVMLTQTQQDEIDRLSAARLSREGGATVERYADQFAFESETERRAYEFNEAVGITGSALDGLVSTVNGIVQSFQLEVGGSGWQTDTEAQQQTRRVQAIQSQSDNRSYESLRSAIEERHGLIESGSQENIRLYEAEQDEYYRMAERRYSDDYDLQLDNFDQATDLRLDFYDETEAIERGYTRESLLGQQRTATESLRRARVSNRYMLTEQDDYEGNSVSSMIAYTNRRLEQEDDTNRSSLSQMREFGSDLEREGERAYSGALLEIDTLNAFYLDKIVLRWQTALSTIESSSSTLGRRSIGGAVSRGLSNIWQSFSGRFTIGNSNSGQPASIGMRGLLAAKGAYVDSPTSLIAGERGSEVIMPLDESKGIPTGIMREIGAGMARQITSQDSRIPIFNPTLQSAQTQPAMTYSMQFGDITIGNEMTRGEVEGMFRQMQVAIVEVISTSTQGTYNRKYNR